jgi:hypothetical protein
MEVLLPLHALATIMMAGFIWFVQLVHCPLFLFIGASEFARYEQEHSRRVTSVVAPVTGIEALTAIALVILAAGITMREAAIVGLLLLAVIWASTVFVQVPCHRRLSTGFDLSTARCLVTANWLRTLAWTARAGVAMFMLVMMQS